MKIAIVGAGYVGLVSGVGFAQRGHQVRLIEIDLNKVNMINQGKSPIHEEGLEMLLGILVPNNLRAISRMDDGIDDADVLFFCVQSSSCDNETVDLTYIEKAAIDVGMALKTKSNRTVVCVKSTVAPGTTEGVIIPTLERYSGRKMGVDIAVMAVPEFLREGTAIADFMKPYRIIVGGSSEWGEAILSELYQDFDAPIIKVDLTTAEMIKCASNAFLATKVSFINEIGNICKRLGIDAYKVAEGMGVDPRISPHYLNAGIGFGGSCLPKDTRCLCASARKLGYQPTLLESVLKINEDQPLRLVQLADERVGGLAGKEVAVLGLAFKPGTDDVRKAPSLKVIGALKEKGAIIRVYDPVAEKRARLVLGEVVSYCPTASEAVADTQVVFILTEWEEFKNGDLYRDRIVFDGRGVLRDSAKDGLDYEGICW